MRTPNRNRRLRVETLEARVVLAANLAVDINTSPTATSQLAVVENDVYFSTTNGTETQIRRFADNRLTEVAQHRIFDAFDTAAPTFFYEVGDGLMYGFTDPFFAENLSDATFQIWYADTGSQPNLIRELPVMDLFGEYRSPANAVTINDNLVLQDNWGAYQIINRLGDTLDTWSAPIDQVCQAPIYGAAHTTPEGLAIEAAYPSCRQFLTPIVAQTDGLSFEEVDVHPTSLYLPNGTEVTSDFSRESNAEELFFRGTNRFEMVTVGDGSALQPEGFTRFNANQIFFSGDSQGLGREPWVTDGTAAGTVLLRDINTGAAASSPQVLGNTPRGLIFSAASPSEGRELWITDGTPGGTQRLSDVRPGARSSNPIRISDTIMEPTQPIESASDAHFFWAESASSKRELWVTDGTPAGTRRIVENVLGQSTELTAQSKLADGQHLLAFTNDQGEMQVWVSNGTAPGTRRITGLPQFGNVKQLATSSNNVRTVALQLDSNEIWTADLLSGTSARIWSDADSNQTSGSNPKNITPLGNQVLFTTDVDNNKSEVWIWNPQQRSLDNLGIIAMQRDITIRVIDSDTALFTSFNVVRALNNGRLSSLGTQVIEQHETAARHSYLLSTRNVLTIVDANLSNTQAAGAYSQIAPHDGVMFALNTAGQLLRFTGTNATPLQNAAIPESAKLLAGAPGRMWVLNGSQIQQLDLSNGRALSTVNVGEPLQDPITDALGNLFWRSSATRTWKALRNGVAVTVAALGDVQQIDQPTAVGNRVFFVGVNSRDKRSLWVADGTASGSMKLLDLPGLTNLTTDGQKLLFTGANSLWESDGTQAGTRLLPNVDSAIVSATASDLNVIGTDLYVAASDGIHGREIFSIPISGTDSTPIPGDVNQDNRVGFDDFLVLSSNFGRNTQGGSEVGDFDEDGSVAFADFLVLSSNFDRGS